MTRRLILGRAGSGKTHLCLERVTRLLREGGRALLLVPTESQAEHLRLELLQREGGLRRDPVVTFSRLAERLCGLRLRDLTPLAERDRMAERALAPGFPAAAGQAGFRAEFLAAVKEIKEQGLAPQEAVERARAHFPEASRGRLLFEAFFRFTEELCGGFDHEDLMLAGRDRLKEHPMACDLLAVDGFHDFTPVQLEIVDLLAGAAGETIVTLPLDPGRRGDPVFATAEKTAGHFAGYAREPLTQNQRCQGALAVLENRLFQPAVDRVPAPEIETYSFPTEEDEADRLARWTVRLGRPFQEILLIRRSFTGLLETYREAFARHGVPLRFFGSEPLGSTAAARAVSIWLRHLRGRAEPEELGFLLRSPYLLDPPPLEEVDRFVHALREGAVPELPAALETALTAPDGELRSALRNRFGIARALEDLPGGDAEIAKAARLFELLAVESRAVQDLPRPEGIDRLLARIPHLRGRTIDRRFDCVYAVEASEARQWEKPVVLVAGLSADSFPHQFRQDLFIRDDERRAFAAERGLALPPRSRREEEERYLFYVALTRARERLVLSRTAYAEDGSERAASPYLEEALAQVVPGVARSVPMAAIFPGPEEAIEPGDLFPIVADGLARSHLGEGALAASLYELEAVPRARLAWPRRLERARRKPIRPLPLDPARTLSASDLNAYLRCPYLFLARKILRVGPERGRELDPLLRGTIVHEALERCHRESGDPGAIFDAIFAERTAGMRLGLAGEATRRWMRATVVKAAGELRLQPVEAVEQRFEIEAGDVRLRGIIDRIDRYPEGAVVRDYKTGNRRIKAVLEFEDLQLDTYLLAVDTPAGAVYERLKRGGATGFVIEELRPAFPGRAVRTMPRAELLARRTTTRAMIADLATRMRAGELALAPRDPAGCTRDGCEAYDLCRVAKGRWLARLGGGAPA